MSRIDDNYGKRVFSDFVMKQRLPSETYKKLSSTVKEGKELDLEVANVVAHAMKEWAIEQGATHFTHWFQPLTGITSEKHDSFINPQPDGKALLSFSGKELIKGEPDASSFPSGGLRATFEARGYTAWDPTSYAFLKDNVLCIPTAFASYTGEALDKKTPLLRSMEAISEQAVRVLKLLGKNVGQVKTTVGPEQEYFLIDEEDYKQRPDLILTGRTLFGAPPCKGQELEEHYFGAIRPTVSRFMQDLDTELWELGIPAKTKHNEVSPAQHELAPIFQTTNVAIDSNLITMEMMRIIASRHGLVCLQHEKPFVGVNGSGKHNNWSLSTDTENLLEPGKTPEENLQFFIFLTATIQAVNEYQDLLRISVATAGNDHRLGANEAPPAIVSVFVGDELSAIIDSLIKGGGYDHKKAATMDLGVKVIPQFMKDTTDRNRTSPFAFTGNKFEFRMPGSQVNLADTNTVLNAAAAKALKDFADALDGKKGKDFEVEAWKYIAKVLKANQRILFNGDNYSEEWYKEAEKRGLENLISTVDALPCLLRKKNLKLYEDFKILSETELKSRYEVKLEQYSKLINIEALTSLSMARRQFLPAVTKYSTAIAKSISAKQSINKTLVAKSEVELLKKLSTGIDAISNSIDKLDAELSRAEKITDTLKNAQHYNKKVIPAMDKLRAAVDGMEGIVAKKYWPVPNYNRIMFYT